MMTFWCLSLLRSSLGYEVTDSNQVFGVLGRREVIMSSVGMIWLETCPGMISE